MESKVVVEHKGGMSFLSILALILITLKLTGHVTVSWWWVLTPLWAPFVIALIIVLVVLFFAGIAAIRKASDNE